MKYLLFLNRMFALHNRTKMVITMSWDSLCLLFAFLGSYWIRLGIGTDVLGFKEISLGATVLIFHLSMLIFVGNYRHMVRHLSQEAVLMSLLVSMLASCYLYFARWPLDAFVPNSMPIIYFVLSSIGILGPRILVMLSVQSQSFRLREKCLIYGAGETGRALALSLRQSSDMVPVAFIDDKRSFQGKTILGLDVYSRASIPQLVERYSISKLLLAVSDSGPERHRELLSELEPYAIELLSVPDVKDVLYGRKKINELREVSIEELLGRDPVPPKPKLMRPDIRDKNVLVTGAGGSIGSELCRQIAVERPAMLVLLELSEYNLYQIEAELSAAHPTLKIETRLGDVKDERQIRHLLSSHQINTIYHAAAYKHVPIVEHNLLAGVQNNVLGTAILARLAAESGVEKFLLISTDKAVRPTNIMGASKRMAELCVQAMQDMSSKTHFAIVRFGNVLGSSGSVVPLFKKQIAAGGPITVTHPDIIRYFMTIPEAAQLVIQAGAMGKQGEVFVLDMGEPVKIADMAHKMAHLMGRSIRNEANPDGDIELHFTGLRPGEKLYEELLTGDTSSKTPHPRIMSEAEPRLSLPEVHQLLDKLTIAIHNNDEHTATQLLLSAPLAYKPAEHATDEKKTVANTPGDADNKAVMSKLAFNR
ncbi:nucleoside-diphosphate sugar epimerase/dehydratase [Lacimicrobium sp. SS2-24]|uniref:polysaccharide biosynthesis protein n=1 Tax=Lacimicrobium sp. SS2-24 TaxID=2005569 RepID=UPI001FEDADFF|nr:nucleoside-diphosphate sugar epimerase/dehydratase [Lacimicrobium sp. SS2-24]